MMLIIADNYITLFFNPIGMLISTFTFLSVFGSLYHFFPNFVVVYDVIDVPKVLGVELVLMAILYIVYCALYFVSDY